MNEMPDWLPEMISVSPWISGGNYDTYETLYSVFCRDIRDFDLRFHGNRVWYFPEMEDGKEILFWHLTSRKPKREQVPYRKRKFIQKDDDQDNRLPDMRRSERLSWVNPLITAPDKPEILCWDYEEGDGAVKTYIWIKDYDFVVILKKYTNGQRRLVTSFYVDRKYTKNDFERKYKNRLR